MVLNLKELLENREKSVYWLKQETGISHGTIYKMVNNQTKMISLDNIEKLCDTLKCTPSELITRKVK